MNPTNGTPTAAGGDLMIREKSSPSAVEHNVTASITQGRRRHLGPRGVLRRQEDRLRDALPHDQHRADHGRGCPGAGLYRPLEHLGIRHDHRRLHRRHVPAPDQLDAGRRRRPGLPAGQPGLRVLVEPPDQDAHPGPGRHLLRARRIRARAGAAAAHHGQQRRQHPADLRQSEPRPQPGRDEQRRHHVLALGTRGRSQPLRDLHDQARRHEHVRQVRRAQPGQQLPAPARDGPRRARTRAS